VALAARVTIPETVEPTVGDVIDIEGGVVSGAIAVINVKSPLVAKFPAASRDLTRQ
jgi:hypothetical protein